MQVQHNRPRWLTSLLLLVLLINFSSARPLYAQEQSGITSPAAGSQVSGSVPIFGTAVIDPFQKYELHYKPEPSSDDAYIYFDGNTSPVVNGQLGIWQAGGLPPGTYSLRLRVVKADGNYAEYFAPNIGVNLGAESNSSEEPTPTETANEFAEPTETPIPTVTFTPAPQPTVAVGVVEQPQIEGEQPPTPTVPPVEVAEVPPSDSNAGAIPTPEPTNPPQSTVIDNTASDEDNPMRELGQALAFDTLRSRFWSGVRYSAVLCIGIIALFGGKRIFDWVWSQFRS
jgi:hypothetical protein